MGKEDYVRPAKEAFMVEVAARAGALMRERGFEAVFLAAPPQLIGPLRTRFEGVATAAGAIRKDLTKVPDHELSAWLNAAHMRLPLSS